MSAMYCHEEGCPPTPAPGCLDQVRQRVERISYKDGFDSDTAADLANDVVVGLLKAVHRGTVINNLWAYSVTIYRNRKADLFERRARSIDLVFLGLSIEEVIVVSVEDEVSTDELVPTVSHSPMAIENMIRAAESYGFSGSELMTLGYYLYGFTAAEMARDFTERRHEAMTLAAAEQRMYRMKKHLRVVIAQAIDDGY